MKELLLLWLFGTCLRITVLAIPPVMPQIHASFALTQAQVAALTSLPVLLFSFAAIPGAVLVGRFGALRVLAAGLAITAIAGALRGAAPSIALLFIATFAMGVGIAVMQPALPSIVRDWVPARVALGTAAYSNGLLVGEAISASLTIKLVLPAVGGDWRLSVATWSIPVAILTVVAIAIAMRSPPSTTAPRRGGPDWSDPRTWRLGVLSGYASALYFGTNAFLPDLLAARGRTDLLHAALTALNWAQMPGSILMLFFASRLALRRAPFLLLGSLSIAAVVGLATLGDAWIVPCAAVVGFCNAFLLILTLALPPMMSTPENVHRMSAAMLLVGYLLAFLLPFAGGVAWDATGDPRAAFVPLLAFAMAALFIAARMDFRRPAG